MEKEIWKDINGYEGAYQISNLGRVKSFLKDIRGRVLISNNKTGWYLSVSLCNEIRIKTHRVHVLVATHFIKNPHKKKTVNHKDLNKQNNVVSNLEWATQRENTNHACERKPQMLTGMINYNQNIKPKIVHQYDMDGVFICEHKNSKEASNSTGVCQRNILQVASNDEYKKGKTRKQAGGFIWKYKN